MIPFLYEILYNKYGDCMRVVAQNVMEAKLTINGKVFSSIEKGFVLLVGFTNGDNKDIVDKMANKIIKSRVFQDENGLTNLSILDVNGEILSVSQFTLYGDYKKGNRPSFINALNPAEASSLYDYFNKVLTELLGKQVKTGVFGEDMKVSLTNDGPFTMIYDSKELTK